MKQETDEFSLIIANTIPYGMQIVEKDGTILFANKNLKTLFGNDISGKKCWEVIREDQSQCKNCPLLDSISIGETKICESTGIKGNRIFKINHTGMVYEGKEAILEILHDITDQKKAENHNRQNEIRLQGIIDNLQDAFFQADTAGNFTFINPTALTMYGYTSLDELIGKPATTLYADSKTRDELIQHLKKDKKLNDYTAKALRKDGTAFWVSMNVQFLYDIVGNITGTQGIVRDITERVEFSNQLQKNEKRFRDIFENMPSGYLLFELIYDEQGNAIDHRLIEANAEFNNQTGLNREEQVGRTSKDFPWVWPEEVTRGYYNVALTGQSFSYERFNESLQRYYDIRVSSPQKGQFALLFNDITQRHKAEKERSELLNRFQQIAKHIPGFIYQYHLRTDKTSHFPYASDGIQEIYGVTAEQAMADAQCVFDVLHPDDLQRVSESIFESARTMTVWYDTYRVILPSGKEIWVEGKSTPVQLEDGSVLWHGYIHDISELKNYQNELIKAKEKAENSDRLKTAFLMNLSHEIRTPMNGILGFMSLLNEPGLDEEGRTEYIEIMKKSGNRLMDTINDIVEISKIEVGDINVTLQDVNTVELMQYYDEFFNFRAKIKGLNLIVHQHLTGKRAIIKSDKHKLDGIMMNLIKNALKFTDKGQIEIGNYLHNDRLYFYVSDTGRGIPKDKLEVIFDRFVQADTSINSGYEGTGIGLSIVKAYVEALQGDIEVDSETGKGSTFRFSIPYIPVQAEIKTQENLTVNTGDEEKPLLLIAEDDEVNYYFLKKVLSDKYGLVRATTGEEAVELFANTPDIRLILMDVKMPGGYDGLEATRQIRQFNLKVPIIAQTAFGMNSDKSNALNAGCTDFISKPFSSESLKQLILKHLS